MTAEQVVDSLFAAVGKPFSAEELTFDPAGRSPAEAISAIWACRERAWQFASLSNERDRPALVAAGGAERRRCAGDVRLARIAAESADRARRSGQRAAAAGLGQRRRRQRESRRFPTTARSRDLPRRRHTRRAGARRLSADSFACRRMSKSVLCLSRCWPRDIERRSDRCTVQRKSADSEVPTRRRLVEPSRAPRRRGSSWRWSGDAHGDPPTTRLEADWRERMEDMVWALVNSPEFVFVP